MQHTTYKYYIMCIMIKEDAVTYFCCSAPELGVLCSGEWCKSVQRNQQGRLKVHGCGNACESKALSTHTTIFQHSIQKVLPR